MIECDGEEHEAERAVARIQAQRGAAARPRSAFKDFAVLYRANHQARVFEKALRKASIPYKVSGGQSFFDRAEIKDLCAWLRLLVNNDDDPAFLRAVTTPKRGIGHQTLASLGEFAGKWKTSLFEALFAESLGTALNGARDRLAARVRPLRERPRVPRPPHHRRRGREGAAARLAEGHRLRAAPATTARTARSSPPRAGPTCSTSSTGSRRRCGGEIENDGGVAFETEKKSVLEVAQTISVIISLAERGDEQDVVTLSTLHAAKGLEWPHVVLAGVNEGLLPFRSEDDEMTPQRLEEERRLMYVGITRARSTLAVSTLRRRKRGRDTVPGVPSRFIAEMKLHEVQVEGRPAREAEGAARGGGGARRAAAARGGPTRRRVRAARHRRGRPSSLAAAAGHRAPGSALLPRSRCWLFVFKPLTTRAASSRMPAARAPTTPALRRWVLVGLVLSLAGDVALLWPKEGFLPGLVAFLLAHLAYIVAFTRGQRLARAGRRHSSSMRWSPASC